MKLLENFLLPMRKPLTRLLQVAIIVSSIILSYLLRFDFTIPEAFLGRLLHLLPLVLVIKMTVFWRAGLFHGWWRYIGSGRGAAVAATAESFLYQDLHKRRGQEAAGAVDVDLLFHHKFTGKPNLKEPKATSKTLLNHRARRDHRGKSKTPCALRFFPAHAMSFLLKCLLF